MLLLVAVDKEDTEIAKIVDAFEIKRMKAFHADEIERIEKYDSRHRTMETIRGRKDRPGVPDGFDSRLKRDWISSHKIYC